MYGGGTIIVSAGIYTVPGQRRIGRSMRVAVRAASEVGSEPNIVEAEEVHQPGVKRDNLVVRNNSEKQH